MKLSGPRVIVTAAGLLSAGNAYALMNAWSPITVPVDSPWALAGLGAIIAVVAARLLIKRRG